MNFGFQVLFFFFFFFLGIEKNERKRRSVKDEIVDLTLEIFGFCLNPVNVERNFA